MQRRCELAWTYWLKVLYYKVGIAYMLTRLVQNVLQFSQDTSPLFHVAFMFDLTSHFERAMMHVKNNLYKNLNLKFFTQKN